MAILHVARLGHPVLRRKTAEVPPEDLAQSRIQMLIDDMVTTMADYRTLGLSAPQIRQSLRIIVANVPHNDGSRPTTLIIVNPTLTVLDSEMVEDWEGCGSLPEVRARVSRARSVVVRGVDRMGAPLQIRATGRGARVLQHGLDHLDGVLFVDRMRTFESLVFREYAPPDTALL